MKKRMKSLIALGLSVFMLAGCGNSSNQQSESKTVDETVESSSVTSQQQETQVEESKYPEYLNLESARPIVKEGEEVTLKVAVLRATIAETPVDETWFAKFVEEKLNINLEIEWLTSANSGERTTLMLAADDMPDIFINLLSDSHVVEYDVENGQLMAISDYASEELTPNILAQWDKYADYMAAYTMSNGKIYTIPSINTTDCLGLGNTLSMYAGFVNRDYMKAAGIEELPETVDEFVEMLRKFKALDPKQLGVDEIYPLLATSSWGDRIYLMNALGWANVTGLEFTWPCWDTVEEQIAIPVFQEERFSEFVTVYHTLYEEGLIHPDYFSLNKQAVRALEAEKAGGICFDSAPSMWGGDASDFVFTLPLSSEWSEPAVATAAYASRGGKIHVSANTEYPEVCLRLLDYLCSDEGIVYYSYGCPAESEDTLGMITGWELDEKTRSITYEEVTSGKYSDDYTYKSNVINLTPATVLADGDALLLAQKLVGIEEPKYPELDLTDDIVYLTQYLRASAVEGHLVNPISLGLLSELGDKQETYSDLKTVLDAYISGEFAKFVVGQRDLSELPDFYNEIKAMGGDEYKEIVLNAYKDYVHVP